MLKRVYACCGKRILDLTVAFPAFVLVSPLLVLLLLLVRLQMGTPVFFRHRRPGLYGKPFDLVKLRTMTDTRDGRGRLLPDAARLTPLGRILRQTSLDELPEFFNVLKGEMSIVGPRPLLMAYLQRYSPEQMRRHDAKPGMTGWAQIHGRNATTWDQRFALDLWYVQHQGLWLDVRIMARTIVQLLKREGINQPGEATMREYMGSSGD